MGSGSLRGSVDLGLPFPLGGSKLGLPSRAGALVLRNLVRLVALSHISDAGDDVAVWHIDALMCSRRKASSDQLN